jgi:hypothetical protein
MLAPRSRSVEKLQNILVRSFEQFYSKCIETEIERIVKQLMDLKFHGIRIHDDKECPQGYIL